jgi:hypothetical protein
VPKLTIEWEPLDRLVADGLEDLAALHWEESEIDHAAVPLALDLDRARAFERAGQHKIAGLRRNGELIGYAAFILVTSMFHATVDHAFCDAIYVEPERRGLASLWLLDWCEQALTPASGVCKLYISERIPTGLSDRDKAARFGSLLALRGYTMAERRHCKILGGANVRRRHGTHTLPADGPSGG